jgi:putative Mn2+ efflux pump MntP
MSLFALFAVALALAMDAFAVAVVTGLTLHPVTRRQVFRLAFHFGLFQALMPVVGWATGRVLYHFIESFDHWVAFALLGFVGGRMIWGALRASGEEQARRDPTRGWDLLVLSVATSIDALAVGLSLAVIGAEIVIPAVVIGLVAAALTALGMTVGGWVGLAWGKRFEVLGGLILIGIGARIVYQHLAG